VNKAQTTLQSKVALGSQQNLVQDLGLWVFIDHCVQGKKSGKAITNTRGFHFTLIREARALELEYSTNLVTMVGPAIKFKDVVHHCL
jgi:hypothetical protein